MTVSTQITKRIYEGNGITRQWDIDFPLMAADDLKVYVTSDQGNETEITTGFSVNSTRTQVEYPTTQSGLDPLANGQKITLVRQTPLTQGIDLIRQGELDAEVLEQGYDKLTLAVQELNEKVDRSIKYPVSTQPASTDTENFLKDILAAKQAAVDASSSAVTAAQTASSSAQTAQQTARQAVTSIENAEQTARQSIAGKTQESLTTLQERVDATAQAVATAQYYAEHTVAKCVGEVYYSQSSLATDNPGSLPLFTGETIGSANTLYPDFWTWITSHSELQTTAADYASRVSTYGECPFYVVDTVAYTIKLPLLKHVLCMAERTNGITQQTIGLAAGSDVILPSSSLYPWVCAFSAAVPASTAQAAAFGQALSSKADADFGNVTKPYVTEMYVNGTSWYRTWSNGWCEQGGCQPGNGGGSYATVTLLREMADTNYTVTTLAKFKFAWCCEATDGVKSTTQFSVYTVDSTGQGYSRDFYWVVAGYMA